MKRIFILLVFVLLGTIGTAQKKGTFKWLGSTAQNGGVGGVMTIDTPGNTYTLRGPNYAFTGYAPVCSSCPTFDGYNNPYFVYRTYDQNHNLIKKVCVRTPSEYAYPGTSWNYPGLNEPTPDGHFIYFGKTSDSTFMFSKADSAGVVVWKNTIVSGTLNHIGGIKKIKNGHYILYGPSHGVSAIAPIHFGHWMQPDIFLCETDTLGTIYWKRVVGGTLSESQSIVVEKSKGFLFSGDVWFYQH